MKPPNMVLCSKPDRVACLTCALAGLDTCPALPGSMSLVAGKLVGNQRLSHGQAVRMARDILGDVDTDRIGDNALLKLFQARHPHPGDTTA